MNASPSSPTDAAPRHGQALPVCGDGRLFRDWFRLSDRCATCSYRFEREEGFFLRAYVTNLAIAQALVMLLAVVLTVVLLNADANASLRPVVAGGFLGAVLTQLFFHPWSKPLWVVIELIMRPVDQTELADVRR